MHFERLQALEQHRIASYTASHRDGTCVIQIVGFNTNQYGLTPRQQSYVAMSIPALQQSDHVLEMYARTDRSGTDRYNLALSRRRLAGVQETLLSLGAPRDKVMGPHCKALGERFEAFYGRPDDERSPGGRAVWLFHWASQAAFDEGPDNRGFRQLTQFGRSFVAL